MKADMSEVELIESGIDAEAWIGRSRRIRTAGRLDALMEESMTEHKAGDSRVL